MPTPQLSTGLQTYTTESAQDWSHLADFARAADAGGVDRLVMSDHIVFGRGPAEAEGPPCTSTISGYFFVGS